MVVYPVTNPKEPILVITSESVITPAALSAAHIAEIAVIIDSDWKNVNYAARPYLDAMYELQSIKDSYGADSGKSIVIYFLGNAGAYRGAIAKAIKAELRARVAA